MVKNWGRTWYYIGIAGYNSFDNIVFITRAPNPITDRALPINSMSIAIEIFELIYMGITSRILARQGRIEPKQKEQLR